MVKSGPGQTTWRLPQSNLPSAPSAAPSAPRRQVSHAPEVEHRFEGDANVFDATFDSRIEIRKTLQTLQQLLSGSKGSAVQIVADIKLRVSGPDAQESTYTITVNDRKWDAQMFADQVSSAGEPGKGGAVKSAFTWVEPGHVSGRHGSLKKDDVAKARPAKRQRMETNSNTNDASGNATTESLPKGALAVAEQRSPDDTLEFMRTWHAEWIEQGGWLFDNLNRAEETEKDSHRGVMSQVTTTQEVIGQSINAANATTMAELANISKLVPWLEHCRKTGADKAQAREEKWRMSSATFHDHSRRDREIAEKSLALELQKQRALLVRIAEANGIAVDDGDDEGKIEDRETSEFGLGAQLTAQLNMEASRADDMYSPLEERRQEAISLSDDGEDYK